jgi:uncharacterized membrane protein
MKQIRLILLVIFVATMTGCYYDTEERLYPQISSPCNDTVATFSKTVTTILQPCQSCHSNSAVSNGDGGGIKLQNYTDVQSYANNGHLMGTINHTAGYSAMPKGGGKLPDCEISQLQKWIDNGALNN